MQNIYSQLPSEQYIQKYFIEKFNITLNKIPENGGKDGNTPDFEYLDGEERIFVSELKEIKPPNFPNETSKETVWKKDDHSDGYVRNWNQANLISDGIKRAYKQLKHYTEPKILIFLNHNYFFDVNDLVGTINGYLIDNNGKRMPDNYYSFASEVKIKNIKNKIDLYIWIDVSQYTSTQFENNIVFRYPTDNGLIIFQKYFCNCKGNNIT